MAEDFPGFPHELPGFLHELKLNNEKAWFEANRERFEALAVRPALNFIEAVAGTVGGFDPPHHAVAKMNGSLRRIHRDVRFSKDKSPYNSWLHLVFWAGDHPNRSPSIHVVVSPGGFGIGCGQWALEPAQLKRYREAVMDPKRCASLEKALDAARECGCHLEAPALKRPPKGFENAQGSAAQYILQKGIVARNRNEDFPDGFFDRRCVDTVLARMKMLVPLEKWLMDNLY